MNKKEEKKVILSYQEHESLIKNREQYLDLKRKKGYIYYKIASVWAYDSIDTKEMKILTFEETKGLIDETLIQANQEIADVLKEVKKERQDLRYELDEFNEFKKTWWWKIFKLFNNKKS